jgi:hypothetical protein
MNSNEFKRIRLTLTTIDDKEITLVFTGFGMELPNAPPAPRQHVQSNLEKILGKRTAPAPSSFINDITSARNDQPPSNNNAAPLVDATAKPNPNCDCGAPCVERTVTKETINKGRRFYCCSGLKAPGCKRIIFIDDVLPHVAVTPTEPVKPLPLAPVHPTLADVNRNATMEAKREYARQLLEEAYADEDEFNRINNY